MNLEGESSAAPLNGSMTHALTHMMNFLLLSLAGTRGRGAEKEKEKKKKEKKDSYMCEGTSGPLPKNHGINI